MKFDQKHIPQFALFFGPGDDGLPDPASASDEIRAAFSAPAVASASEALVVPLRDVVIERSLRLVDGIPIPWATANWSGGNGIWRLALTPERLDLYFRAMDFEEIAGSAPSLARLADRVIPGLVQTVSLLGQQVSRVALAVGSAATTPRAAAFEAVNKSIFEGVVNLTPEMRELQGRVNEDWRWEPEKQTSVRVNQIRIAKAFCDPSEATGQFELTADINTAHEHEGDFTGDDIRSFYAAAVPWVESVYAKVGATP